jgi:hypothetical protein
MRRGEKRLGSNDQGPPGPPPRSRPNRTSTGASQALGQRCPCSSSYTYKPKTNKLLCGCSASEWEHTPGVFWRARCAAWPLALCFSIWALAFFSGPPELSAAGRPPAAAAAASAPAPCSLPSKRRGSCPRHSRFACPPGGTPLLRLVCGLRLCSCCLCLIRCFPLLASLRLDPSTCRRGNTKQEVATSAFCECGSAAPLRRAPRVPCCRSPPPGFCAGALGQQATARFNI